MTRTILTAAVLAASLAGGTARAAHNNPWAEEGDTVLAQFHDENQAKSIGTPGEDEMKGVMTRSAGEPKSDNAKRGSGGKDR